MSFGNAPKAPAPPPPPPPPEPIDPADLEDDVAADNLLRRKRRGTSSLTVNPAATTQGTASQTGLYIGGGR